MPVTALVSPTDLNLVVIAYTKSKLERRIPTLFVGYIRESRMTTWGVNLFFHDFGIPLKP